MSGIWLVTYVALWVLFLLMAVVLLGLVRQLGLMQLRLGPESEPLTTREGLQYGTAAPDFEGPDVLDGKRLISIRSLTGRPTILVFFSRSCSACLDFAPKLAEFHRSFRRNVNVVLVSNSSPQSTIDMAETFKLKMPVVGDENGPISKAYLVRATPFAYRMDAAGIVRRRGIVGSIEDLEDLLRDPQKDEVQVSLPG